MRERNTLSSQGKKPYNTDSVISQSDYVTSLRYFLLITAWTLLEYVEIRNTCDLFNAGAKKEGSSTGTPTAISWLQLVNST